MQTGTIQKGMATGQIDSALGPAEAEKFLENGWIVALEDGRFAVGWGAGSWQEAPRVSPRSRTIALFAPDFYMTQARPWWVSEGTAVVSAGGLARALAAGRVCESHLRTSWREPEFARFAAVFRALQGEFRAGWACKAVPVVYAEAEGDGGSEATRSILERGLANARAPLKLYGWWGGGHGIIGLTPESLFHREPGGPVRTMALAGTRRGRLSEREREEFVNDPKERAEHGWVVDDLRERLSAFGDVRVGPTGVLQLPALAHLHTPIDADADADFETLARALHPTPALGFAPRSLGLAWMKTWDEVERRARFGAPFGVRMETDAGPRLQCLVAIRNVQWADLGGARRWRLGSGCGVVAQSVLENEWAELAAKRESVRLSLGL